MSYDEHLKELHMLLDETRKEYFSRPSVPPEIIQTYLQMLDMCLRLEKFLDNDGGIQRC